MKSALVRGEARRQTGEPDLRRAACAISIEIERAGGAVVDDVVVGVGGGAACDEGDCVECAGSCLSNFTL